MATSGTGPQLAMLRNLLLAWVLTLPAAICLSGALFWVFLHVFWRGTVRADGHVPIRPTE